VNKYNFTFYFFYQQDETTFNFRYTKFAWNNLSGFENDLVIEYSLHPLNKDIYTMTHIRNSPS